MYISTIQEGPAALTDEEIILLVRNKHIPAYKLEATLGEPERGVAVRRQILAPDVADPKSLDGLPYQ